MSTNRIDWAQLCYPGPTRVFTAEEMARAGGDGPSPTLRAVVVFNGLISVLTVGINAPREAWLPLGLVLLLLMVAGWLSLQWLWWRPSRRPLLQCSLVQVAVLIGSALVARELVDDARVRTWVAAVLAVGSLLMATALWFLVMWRAQQIESRLAELVEREQAVEMARRLAAAQLEPHFLFNTLASLQHWVDTRDERASPLLAALTGYLRATLPMFKRPTQPLGDELEAVERYLQVMQARLGARLAWKIDVPPALSTRPLPSGVLLTLVENAVQHGIEPSIAGGRVQIRAHETVDGTVIEVDDDGPGLARGAQDGVGLTNVRQRLALVLGPAASLTLADAPAGGCRARLSLPRDTGVKR